MQQPVPTYYPGVTGMDQAQPIAVERGASTMGVEIALVDAVTVQVSGTLVDASRQPITRAGNLAIDAWRRGRRFRSTASGAGSCGTRPRVLARFAHCHCPSAYRLRQIPCPVTLCSCDMPGYRPSGAGSRAQANWRCSATRRRAAGRSGTGRGTSRIDHGRDRSGLPQRTRLLSGG